MLGAGVIKASICMTLWNCTDALPDEVVNENMDVLHLIRSAGYKDKRTYGTWAQALYHEWEKRTREVALPLREAPQPEPEKLKPDQSKQLVQVRPPEQLIQPEQPVQRLCTKCGMPVAKRFCRYCGTPVQDNPKMHTPPTV
jgi:hypothetical protein